MMLFYTNFFSIFYSNFSEYFPLLSTKAFEIIDSFLFIYLFIYSTTQTTNIQYESNTIFSNKNKNYYLHMSYNNNYHSHNSLMFNVTKYYNLKRFSFFLLFFNWKKFIFYEGRYSTLIFFQFFYSNFSECFSLLSTKVFEIIDSFYLFISFFIQLHRRLTTNMKTIQYSVTKNKS